MKNLIPGLFVLLLIGTACQRSEEKGLLRFDMSLEESALKSGAVYPHLSVALVSITAADGDLIYDNEPVNLYRFGDSYTTASIPVPVGESSLTGFMLADSLGVVHWATPLEGAPLAHLVDEPLPQSFLIDPDNTTSVGLQVIPTGNHPPADFGYLDFNIGFVEGFCLQVEYIPTLPEDRNDSTPRPGVPWFEPRLHITAEGRQVLDAALKFGHNNYELPLIFERFTLQATGFFGEVFYERIFHVNELALYRCGPDYPALIISHQAEPVPIVTPEELEEPDIMQGVFGRITIPGNEIDESGQPAPQPAVREICIFPANIMDSVYTFAPIGCYIPADMIRMPPLAVVRSNNSGYYQLPLDPGLYYYAIREGEFYYIDSYISSRRPGQFTVYPMEVSFLHIHIIDCSAWM